MVNKYDYRISLQGHSKISYSLRCNNRSKTICKPGQLTAVLEWLVVPCLHTHDLAPVGLSTKPRAD